MTAPLAVYVTCPSPYCDGLAEIDPSNPELVQCGSCEAEFAPDAELVKATLEAAGYSHSDRHGWRTDADIQDDSWNCECEDCHPGHGR